MKRRNVALVAVLALALSLVAFGTVAFLSAEARTTNVITTGKVGIDLIERTLEGGELVEVGAEGMTLNGVLPGQTVSKQVSVKNQDDTADAWVRVKVETKVLQDGEQIRVQDGLIRLNIDTQNWIEQDGCYYYKKPLPTAQESKPLFTEVTFDGPAMSNAYQGCEVQLAVSAEAVQCKHNAGEGKAPITELTAENLSQLQGWPDGSADPTPTTP